jgi:hypothetical protein
MVEENGVPAKNSADPQPPPFLGDLNRYTESLAPPRGFVAMRAQ